MGCDIHVYRECRDAEGQWQTLEKTDTDDWGDGEVETFLNREYFSRDYRLFGLLSRGVRTEWTQSFETRGMPDDASPEVSAQHQKEGSDAHSANWLSLQELKQKAAELLIDTDPPAQALNQSLVHFLRNLHFGEVPAKNCRIVFWFNN